MSGVYDGLTVIEIADRRNQWAGKLLADGGARVIQVEPVAGSPGRWSGPFVDDVPDPDRCLDYWWYNTGKQSLALQIDRRHGQELVRRLAAKADVFLESTKPGTLAQYGLDYASLSGNEGLIYASLTDFGQDGPWRDYEMNDHAHLALGGQMGVTGYSDLTETPIGGHGHQAWKMGCVFTLHGITVSLFDRLTSGVGQYIDVSIHDCCAIGSEGAIPEWLYYNETFYRQTGFHASNIRQPDLELPTGDGRYVIAMTAHYSDHSWANLVTWMEEKGVLGELGDPRYRDAQFRAADIRNGTAVRSGIRRLLSTCTAEEAFHRAQSIGITWAAIHAPEENYEIPHYQQRDFWREIDQPEIGRSVTYPRGPFTSDQIRLEPRGRAPHLGEHTRLILKDDLGLEDSAIDALIAAGVAR